VPNRGRSSPHLTSPRNNTLEQTTSSAGRGISAAARKMKQEDGSEAGIVGRMGRDGTALRFGDEWETRRAETQGSARQGSAPLGYLMQARWA